MADYRVLIVDDSKLARMSIAKAISALYPDWPRDEAGNADSALELAQTGHIDIALVDYNMPGRDGLTLATELRERYPSMPLALITANFQAKIVAGAKRIDVTFLQKPNWQAGLAVFLTEAVTHLNASGVAVHQ
jgi:DNA-binding NarL/FixJ family response regulator